MIAHDCPICRMPVVPATGYRVPRHRDGIGKQCPASGKDYRIVETAAE